MRGESPRASAPSGALSIHRYLLLMLLAGIVSSCTTYTSVFETNPEPDFTDVRQGMVLSPSRGDLVLIDLIIDLPDDLGGDGILSLVLASDRWPHAWVQRPFSGCCITVQDIVIESSFEGDWKNFLATVNGGPEDGLLIAFGPLLKAVWTDREDGSSVDEPRTLWLLDRENLSVGCRDGLHD